jgi:hypothetical protein
MSSLAILIAFLAACRGAAQDAPCGIAAGRFFTIAKDELATSKVDDATRRAVEDQLPAMRDGLERACKDDAWTATVRNCIANAPDHVALQQCEQQLTETQRRGLDRAARGETP